MNLTSLGLDDSIGPVPTAPREISDSYKIDIPQSNNSVNTYATQGAENYSPNSKISDTEMFDIIGGKVGTLNNSPTTKNNKNLEASKRTNVGTNEAPYVIIKKNLKRYSKKSMD